MKNPDGSRIDDYCDGSTLIEGTCNNNSYSQSAVSCPSGCSNGICNKTNNDPWAEIWIDNGTVYWSAVSRSSGGATELQFLYANGCNLLTRVASDAGGSYAPDFNDWHTAVLRQFVSSRGYIDVSKTLINPVE